MQQRRWIWALCALVVWGLWRSRVRIGLSKLWPKCKGCQGHKGDSLVGTTAVVEQAMAPGAKGQVVVAGTVWMARNVGVKHLPAGLTCRVTAMDHLTLWVNGDR